MKHLSQQMLQMELRRPHLTQMRRRLQDQLRRPSVSPEAAEILQRRLEVSGKPQSYKRIGPASFGSVDPGPMPIAPIEIDLERVTHRTLSSLPHARLHLYATQQGLPVRANETKAQIVHAILNRAQGES